MTASEHINLNDPYWALRETSPLTEEQKAFLQEVLPPERTRGRFRRGKLGGPGRPKGSHGVYNFRRLVAEYVERGGGSVEDVVAQLFEDLMDNSMDGDTHAAKLLIERLCGKDAEQLDIAMQTAKLNEVERAARIVAILAAAQKRREQELLQ